MQIVHARIRGKEILDIRILLFQSRREDGKVRVFNGAANTQRLHNGCSRLHMPKDSSIGISSRTT